MLSVFAKKSPTIELHPELLKSILVLGAVVEARDAYTGGHNWRVARYSQLLAHQAGLSKAETFVASLGGFIHDIGKVGIPDQILNKNGPLTAEEFAQIKSHARIGHTLLVTHPLAPLILDSITHHHERIDGQGYPEGMLSEKLSIFPRIIAVADSFDAMTSTRAYRDGITKGRALERLREVRNSQLDASLVDHFVTLGEKRLIDEILGHSAESRPLVNCPMDGPIIAVPQDKKAGDTIYCHACKGLYRLHGAKETFELELFEQRRFDLQPEIDFVQINDLAKKAPKSIQLPKLS